MICIKPRTKMSRSIFAGLGVLFFIMSTTGCKMHFVQPSQYPYHFVNQTNVPLTLDLYGSRDDYNNNTNRLERHVMSVGDTQEVIIDVGKTYWYDWYSGDYRYSNWAITHNGDSYTTIQFGKTSIRNVFQVEGPDTVRAILLTEANLASNWQGVDTAADSLHGTHEFTF